MTAIYIHRYRGPRINTPLTDHSFWEITCAVASNGILTCDREVELKRNGVYLMPPKLRHREISDSDLDTIWIGIQGSLLPPGGSKVLMIEDAALTHFIEKLWLFSRASGEAIGPELDGMTGTIVGWFFRLLASSEKDVHRDLSARVIQFLEKHFSESISLADLSHRFGCSDGYLSRCFQKKTGASPMAYLKRVRLHQATSLLLQSELPIFKIAQAVGYDDPFYFSRTFHEELGESPTDYRKKFQTEA